MLWSKGCEANKPVLTPFFSVFSITASEVEFLLQSSINFLITLLLFDKEIEIGKDLARQEGKPEEMLEKISMGRLKKFFKENTLINQTFIKDSKKTVMQYLKECNDDWKIVEFNRVNLG